MLIFSVSNPSKSGSTIALVISLALSGLKLKKITESFSPIVAMVLGLSNSYKLDNTISVSPNVPFGSENTNTEKYCLGCGVKLKPNAKFCDNCGKKVD